MSRRSEARFLLVIPGRVREHANPESRNEHRASIWIPGPALRRRPGMTSGRDTRRQQEVLNNSCRCSVSVPKGRACVRLNLLPSARRPASRFASAAGDRPAPVVSPCRRSAAPSEMGPGRAESCPDPATRQRRSRTSKQGSRSSSRAWDVTFREPIRHCNRQPCTGFPDYSAMPP